MSKTTAVLLSHRNDAVNPDLLSALAVDDAVIPTLLFHNDSQLGSSICSAPSLVLINIQTASEE